MPWKRFIRRNIVAYDLQLYVFDLEKIGWFTFVDLNNRIEYFPYSKEDMSDKPCKISKTKTKLGSGAFQIFQFLRFFPLYVKT